MSMADLCFDELQVGFRFAPLDKGRITTAHIMRWSAAVENWHRIHYDYRFATEHDKLPDVLINGSWKQHVLVQLLKDGLGHKGWLWKMKFRYKKMDLAGESLRATAEVTGLQVIDGLGFVTLSILLLTDKDEISTVGTAIGVLPLRGGRAVPYPFERKAEYAVLQLPADD
jgi:acyl dehydratase